MAKLTVPATPIKILLFTTSSDHSWFNGYIQKALETMKTAPFVNLEALDVRTIDPKTLTPETRFYPGDNLLDGGMRPTHDWFNRTFTQHPEAAGYNVIGFHFSPDEKEKWDIEKGLGGMYWNDNNDRMEFFMCAGKNSLGSSATTRIPPFHRIFLHEIAHAFIHFSERKEELVKKFQLDQYEGTYQDPVHFFDYTLKDVRKIFPEISFERYSTKRFINVLLQHIINLLTLEILKRKQDEPLIPVSHPEPKPADPASKLDAWGKAIEVFEDYVAPGGRYRSGAIAHEGSLSYRNHNPGNLRWSPFQAGVRNNFAYFNTYKAGWEALLHQLRIAADGRSSVYRPEMTLQEFFEVYAPSSDNNHPENYAKFVADRIGVPVTTQIKSLI